MPPRRKVTHNTLNYVNSHSLGFAPRVHLFVIVATSSSIFLLQHNEKPTRPHPLMALTLCYSKNIELEVAIITNKCTRGANPSHK